MSDIDHYLAMICAMEEIAPPAREAAIERLRSFARDTYRTDLPEGHVTLLRRHDASPRLDHFSHRPSP